MLRFLWFIFIDHVACSKDSDIVQMSRADVLGVDVPSRPRNGRIRRVRPGGTGAKSILFESEARYDLRLLPRNIQRSGFNSCDWNLEISITLYELNFVSFR
jgi:hypothetical protein